MFTLTHNGYTVNNFQSFEEVENYIFVEVLAKHKDLSPKEIYRGYAEDNKAEHANKNLKSVIIFQYYTLYTEVFMIEEQTI